MRISHGAIYQAFYLHGRGALRRELPACLRTASCHLVQLVSEIRS